MAYDITNDKRYIDQGYKDRELHRIAKETFTGQLERQRDLKKRQEVSDASREDIKRDVAFGTQYGKELIGDKSLGRLTSGEQEADIVKQGRLNALQGFSAPELGAARGQAISNIDSASEGALRRLKGAQASSGVRGASATAQQAGVLEQGVEQKRQLEQGLLLENRTAQQAALDKLQENVQADLAAQSSEKFAQLSTGLGFAQIGSAERAGLAANEAQLASARAQGGGGGK